LTYTSDLSGDQRKRLVSKQNLVSNNIKFVITNYDLLRSETKKVKVPKKQSVELTNALLAECGPLFQIEWQRVIYDEAHIVRNAEKNTRGNIACTLLPAKRRWALTGTAFNNSVLDLYGVCRVLHAAPYNQKLWWKKRTGGLADTEH
jgi:SNF2 family DNA or RNA helicase